VHTHHSFAQSNTKPSGDDDKDDDKDKVTLKGRRFIAEDDYPPRFSLKDIEVEIGAWMCVACPASTSTCPTCKQFEGHEDSLLLAIHGACITENKVTRSSFGLYYGVNNLENVSHAITGKAHTNQIAVLTACLRALRNATSIMNERLKLSRKGNELVPLRTFIIKTDSEYLVRGITEWLPKWKEAGWKTCKGVTVANADLFKLVEAGITVLERVVEVKFWLVPKKNNQEAEYLAKWAIMH
jgi:ribonuclease HI